MHNDLHHAAIACPNCGTRIAGKADRAGLHPLVGFGLVLWLVFYLPTAMRKVYGGGRLLTALRWIVLGAMHLVCIVLAIAAAAALAVVA